MNPQISQAPTLPAAYTSAQFEAAVASLKPRVAVFDCDGTLWAEDSGSAFMRWSMQSGLLSRSAIRWLEDRYSCYLRGDVDELRICGEMVQVYQGLPETELRRAAAEFFAVHIAAGIFLEMQRIVSRLQRSGSEIWAVSSTNKWVVEEGVKLFNIPADHVLAACVEVENGIVTSNLLDVPTDEGKVAALARAGVNTPDAVFGNSIHDAAMLAISRQAFPVNPSAALVDRSAGEGWTVFFPALADTS